LDAHNDLSTTSSVDDDSQGFIGTVTSSGSFPLTFQDGFQIRAGHTNMVIRLLIKEQHLDYCFSELSTVILHITAESDLYGPYAKKNG
jgi:hypothetical protein